MVASSYPARTQDFLSAAGRIVHSPSSSGTVGGRYGDLAVACLPRLSRPIWRAHGSTVGIDNVTTGTVLVVDYVTLSHHTSLLHGHHVGSTCGCEG